MAGELPIEPLGLPPGASVGGQGIVGTKGDLKADINTDKQFFGVAGRVDAKLVLTELREVFKVLEGIVEGGNVAFFELQARYRVKSKEDLLSAVRRAGRQAEIVKEAAKSFGQPIDLFSAQLTGGGTGPNSTAYFEVWIQPIPAIPDAGLGIGVVMRSPSQEEFALSANRFEIDLSRFLNALLDTKP